MVFLFLADYNKFESKGGIPMREILQRPTVKYWLSLIGKTIFYFAIILFLIYLYHYKSIHGGNFIYNEF